MLYFTDNSADLLEFISLKYPPKTKPTKGEDIIEIL